nr:nucleotide sugar dehydrogenase [Agromyces soli]
MSTTLSRPRATLKRRRDSRREAVLQVGIVGTGYVGLPLGIALAQAGHRIRGFDTDQDQRASAAEHAAAAGLTVEEFVAVPEPAGLAGCDVFIITVPTPTQLGRPDLRHVEAACASVATAMAPGALVILESTVSPGTTRNVCLPILEQASGLLGGPDFRLAYSPERINPGDPDHRIGSVPKVVAGLDGASLEAAAALYGGVTDVHRAPSIEVAELAKLVENTQRDVNVAFVNEVSNLANALGLQTSEVLEVAATKWNFLPFRPGVVGGHCIAEDPHYLLAAGEASGVAMPTVSAARATNADRADRIADALASAQPDPADGTVVIYGASYKANVLDCRNSAADQLERALARRGYRTTVVDPLVEGDLAFERHHAALIANPAGLVVAAIVHDRFAELANAHVRQMVRRDGTVVDLTGALDPAGFPRYIRFD